MDFYVYLYEVPSLIDWELGRCGLRLLTCCWVESDFRVLKVGSLELLYGNEKTFLKQFCYIHTYVTCKSRKEYQERFVMYLVSLPGGWLGAIDIVVVIVSYVEALCRLTGWWSCWGDNELYVLRIPVKNTTNNIMTHNARPSPLVLKSWYRISQTFIKWLNISTELIFRPLDFIEISVPP